MNERYPLKKTGENFYHMASDQGNYYHVHFKPVNQNDTVQLYTDLPDAMVYEMYFDEVKRSPGSNLDKKIGATIYRLIEDFLAENVRRAVFYITSRNDGRNHELFRVYKLWHRAYHRDTDETRIVKIDRVIKQGDYIEAYCCSLMLERHFRHVDLHGKMTLILEEIYPNYQIEEI